MRSSSATSALPRPLLERAYYLLKLTRAVEDRAAILYRQNHIKGGNFSSRGQEAISVGTCLALGPEDKVAPMIRNLGAVLTRGWSPRDVFASYLARATSPNGGKDNSTHFGDIEKTGVIACISMLGTLVPVLTGMALAAKLKKRKLVTMTYIGDGATSTGEFHEGLNFAAVYQVPFVLIIENNQWAYSTPVSRQTPVEDLAVKAAAYGIPYAIGDGNDVAEVYALAKQFVDRAREGGGPGVIEFKTMRMRGHAQHDDAGYVPKRMFEEWAKKDPIDRCERLLEPSAKEKSEIEARIEREVSEAEQFALSSPHPKGEEAIRGVFADDGITAFNKWWNDER